MKNNFLIKIGILSLLISACQKADLSLVENLRGGEIAVIGHGGIGFPSPEVNLPSNSWESITKAVEGYQAEGVEVDVQLSADGVLYLYHDSRLQTLTDCVGCLYQYESTELQDCKYVASFNAQLFNEQKLVRLDSIIEHFSRRTPKPYIFLDLKTSPDCPYALDYSVFEQEFIDALVRLFVEYNCEEWLIIESGELSFLQKLQVELPAAKLNFFAPINDISIQQAVDEGFYGLSANFDLADAISIRDAHDQGLFVTLGILKIRRDAIEMIEKSPDFIFTDNIPLLQSILH